MFDMYHTVAILETCDHKLGNYKALKMSPFLLVLPSLGSCCRRSSLHGTILLKCPKVTSAFHMSYGPYYMQIVEPDWGWT